MKYSLPPKKATYSEVKHGFIPLIAHLLIPLPALVTMLARPSSTHDPLPFIRSPGDSQR